MSWYRLIFARFNSTVSVFLGAFRVWKLKKIFKKMALFFLSIFGVLSWLHYRNRNKVSVLMLHGVMKEQAKNLWTPLRPQISPDELKRSLTILSHYYQFINLEQAIEIIKGNAPEIKHALLITFDDGYRNNLDYALPICKEFGIKPVICLATGYVDSRLPFWFDRLDYALQQHIGGIINLKFESEYYKFNAASLDTLRESYKEFRDTVKKQFNDDIKMSYLLSSLAEILEVKSGKALCDICDEDDWSAIAEWNELKKEVVFGNIDIASHTIDHVRLGCLSETDIIHQINESKDRIEKELEVVCDIFCYPNGDYNKLAIKLLKESGYKVAFSTDAGLCNHNDDLMSLKRFSFPVGKSEAELLYLLNR